MPKTYEAIGNKNVAENFCWKYVDVDAPSGVSLEQSVSGGMYVYQILCELYASLKS